MQGKAGRECGTFAADETQVFHEWFVPAGLACLDV